jgi:hypothetical protein
MFLSFGGGGKIYALFSKASLKSVADNLSDNSSTAIPCLARSTPPS